MEYFVSIENTNYFYWQIELLIQSFKILHLEDSLTIAVATHDEHIMPIFSTAIRQHKKLFEHKNFGEEYNPLNKLTSLIFALRDGRLHQPFTLIHSDMILTNPVPETEHSPFIGFETESVDQVVLEKINPFMEKIFDVRGVTIPSIPLGSVMIFNGIPLFFFERVYHRAKELIEKTGTDWNVEKGAWLLTLYECLGFYTHSQDRYCTDMMQNRASYFIHYKYGTGDNFNKKHFQYNSQVMLTDNPNPYEVILRQPPTINTQYMQAVVNEYIADQNKYFESLTKDFEKDKTPA